MKDRIITWLTKRLVARYERIQNERFKDSSRRYIDRAKHRAAATSYGVMSGEARTIDTFNGAVIAYRSAECGPKLL